MTDHAATVVPTVLLLTIDQVPIGATVYLIPPGEATPLTDEDGLVPPLTKLIGGVPARAKLYPVGSIQNNGRSVAANGFDTDQILSGVMFLPVDTYTAETAPRQTVFAVFVDGQRMVYVDHPTGPDDMYHVTVYRDVGGRLISVGPYHYALWQREMVLPPGAVLVATCAVGSKLESPGASPERRAGRLRVHAGGW